MMKWLKYILLAVSIACCGVAYCAAPSWEQTGQYKTSARADNKDKAINIGPNETDRVDISVVSGYIYIRTPKSLNIKVTSILGQLISQQTVTAGAWRMKVNVRGIYILKIGDKTTRVTI